VRSSSPSVLIIIVLLGLELCDRELRLAAARAPRGQKPTWSAIGANWAWVYLGNLLGSIVYGGLLAITLTNMGTIEPAGVAARIVSIAEAKTIANEAIGLAGMVSVFVKAILCNWLVLSWRRDGHDHPVRPPERSFATWMPIFMFFALGFEHAVVNMFIIPTGMMLGAKVSVL